MTGRGVFPGSFDPLTIAHLAIADRAHEQCALTVLDLVISEVALSKEDSDQPPAARRAAAIEELRGERPWLRARTTSLQLLADIAEDYDVLVIGADKWMQLHDPRFYGGSTATMRATLARLPTVAVAARAGFPLPAENEVVILDVAPEIASVSATAVRSGERPDWRAGGPD